MKVLGKFLVVGLFIALLTASCAKQEAQNESATQMMETPEEVTMAVAQIHAPDGNELMGTVTFTQDEEGVNVIARINGLEPGEHGFHIHEYGDCTASDLTSAGGHYNPYDVQHGAPTDSVRHVGDMGNLPVNEEGYGNLNYTDKEITLNGPNNVIGRGIIIHAGSDDFTSQPSGAAGARMACGVIGIANPENME